jgi:type IV secretory pathway TraG/TraD family ATPase VirD4
VGDYGSRSLQRSIRRVPIMPPETIRTLPFGTALVLLRSAPPLVTDLRKWAERKDADVLRSQRAAVESVLHGR